MLSPELLAILRCPQDPTHQSVLAEENDALVCQRCRLVFPVRDGFPTLLPEEAILPPGCASLDELPCRKERLAVSG